MKVEGKVKKILPKEQNHILIMDKDNTTVDGESIEKDLFLSAFGSCKGITEGKTYSFDVKVNGDFNNYNPKTVTGIILDGEQPEIKEETVEEEPKKESTKTPESIARVKEHQEKLNGQAFGMLFNNTILILIDQGESKQIPQKFDDIFDGLKKLHDKKRKELNVI